MHIGLESGADRFDDPGASPVVRLVKNQAKGAEPGQITDQLLLGQGAGNIDRPDVNPGPAALLQNAVDPALVREGELPRRVRPAGGEVR